ncbi:uncharacterized protein [Dermacentor andersoni]|uniref:uncharacterized protein isoform X5 n=1 Tax=Dermacentor andersoni TaxID=34620 RepID=UPI003B3A1D01
MCRLAICASRTSTIVLSRTGFVDAGSEHALHQAYLLLPPAVCPAGFIGQNKSQEAVPRALHWDHLTSTVTSTETSWHPDKSSSLFDVPFSGLGSTERARMLIKFFLIAQVSQNFVLCQDGLTPCHLMLSLSDRFQDMGPLFKAKRREHGVQDMVHAVHNGLTWMDKALKSSISL